MKAYTYQKLTPELYAEWFDLWDKSGSQATAFNSPAWLKAAVSAFEHQEVKIVVVRGDDQELLAVAALVKYRQYGVPVYAAPALEFADKQPILIDWSHWEIVEMLTNALKELGTVTFNYCTDETKIRLQHALSDCGITFQDDLNYLVDLSVSPTGDLSSNAKSKIRRTMKKLNASLSMRFSQDDDADLFKSVYEIEATSTKTDRGMSVFDRPEVRTFYEILSTLHPKLVNVSLMEANNAPIAYSIELWGSNTYQGSQKAFVKGLEQFQPSKYMVMKILEHAYENGYRTFDFGRGTSEFKRHFTDNVRPLYTLIIPTPRLVGIYLAAIYTLRQITYDNIARQRTLYKAFKTMRATLRI